MRQEGESRDILQTDAEVPLCVDLDGTLLKTDLLYESLLAFWKREPSRFLMPFLWFLRGGKVHLKMKLAEASGLDVRVLPIHQEFVEYLRMENARGRQVYLATAAARDLAEQVAAHLNVFSGVFASQPGVNLSGSAKAEELVRRFGRGAFDYAGNSKKDLFVWRAARRAVLVNTSEGFASRTAAAVRVDRVFPVKRRLKSYLRCMRVHQWAKNVLVFAPLVAAHQLHNLPLVAAAVLAFFAFSFAASSTYLVNDLLDLESDRKHSTKRRRPFAAGDVPVQDGFVLAPLLFLSGVGLGFLVSPAFVLILLLYAATTLAYSLYLKRLVLVDVMVLAGFYTVRMVAGGVALGIALSFWMLAFTMFLFLSLALSKRYAELHNLQTLGIKKTDGRGYSSQDIESLRAMGLPAGYAAVLVLALYVNSAEVVPLYPSPRALWIICTMALYWISWIWMKASRGELNEDPLVFALTDRTSYVVGAVSAAALILAIYPR